MSEVNSLMLQEDKNGIVLPIHVQPRASRECIKLKDDGRLRVAVTAPPVEDAANKAVCGLLAQVLSIPQRSVTIVSGGKSRTKTVRITGVSAAVVQDKILKHL